MCLEIQCHLDGFAGLKMKCTWISPQSYTWARLSSPNHSYDSTNTDLRQWIATSLFLMTRSDPKNRIKPHFENKTHKLKKFQSISPN